MFEASLVESQTTPISTTKQWTTIGSITLQSALAALLIALPLMHPERLPIHLETPRPLTPLPPKPIVHIEQATASSSTPSTAVLPGTPHTISLIDLFHRLNGSSSELPQPSLSIKDGMGTGLGLPNALTTTGNSTPVSAAPARPNTPVRVSTGIATGLLLAPIRPIYPAIARSAHVEGSVVVEAIISRAGTIESLHVLSGPALLRQAAIEAIQAARYKPFYLNGEPTEVQTTITINFRMES